MTSGIYLLTHTESGNKYVGQSINIEARLRAHKAGLSASRWIARAILKYGWDAFSVQFLERCDRKSLNAAERKWIQIHDCVAPKGFNLTSGGRQQFTVSDETRAKIAAAKANISEETRARIGATSKGRKHSTESIARRVAKQLGSTRSAETRAKQSAALAGRIFTAEHRERISAAAKSRMALAENRLHLSNINIGKTHTAETRAKMATAQIGRRHKPETIAKIVATNTGRHHSEAARDKMSEAAKRAHLLRTRDPSTGRFL